MNTNYTVITRENVKITVDTKIYIALHYASRNEIKIFVFGSITFQSPVNSRKKTRDIFD